MSCKFDAYRKPPQHPPPLPKTGPKYVTNMICKLQKLANRDLNRNNTRSTETNTADNMPHKPITLLIEDDEVIRTIYREILREVACDLKYACNGEEALEAIAGFNPEIVLLDLDLPDTYGLDILEEMEERGQSATVIVVTAEDSTDVTVKAMRMGAFDYLVKPVAPERLITTLQNALERHRLKTKLIDYEQRLSVDHCCDIIGTSLPMQVVYQIITSAASSTATVFITGESGTGKELCAEAIHQLSPRHSGPFVSVNCAAIPKELMESELFGHKKGAFTGALSNRDGAASLAHGGTLFFDEICEMDLTLQSKLLRFIQSKTFQRVGNSKLETTDVRFVCATNRDPVTEVKEKRFREDLFYRLYVVPIEQPPLRNREDDILLLARHFLLKFAQDEDRQFREFSPEAEQLLTDYHWPGNVRQLQNLIRNAVVLHDGSTATAEMLALPSDPPSDDEIVNRTMLWSQSSAGLRAVTGNRLDVRPLWQVEKEAIEQAIAMCKGDVVKASVLLGISDSTIYRKRIKWKEISASD